jgi:ABC-type Na+ efflux pump permease subunit
MSTFTVFHAVNAYLLHLGIVVALILGYWKLVSVVWFFKYLTEFIFIKAIARSFNKPQLLSSVMISEIIYPFYITVLGIFSLFGKFSWKGRMLRTRKVLDEHLYNQ